MNIQNILTCDSYTTLADYCYNWSNDPAKLIPRGLIPPANSVVHVSLDEIQEFFNLIRGTSNKYVVISSKSDYGLSIQKQEPVWRDLAKWVQMQAGPHLGYSGISNMPPRCDPRKCRLEDQYSIRMYSWTGSTLPNIPPNIIKWFVVNNNIRDDRVESIPFGMESGVSQYFTDLHISQNRKLLYVNFSANTLERYNLKQFFQQYHVNGVTLIGESNLTKSQYVQDLLSHKFVLCPSGNGLDGYRFIEALVCGCIPVVPDLLLYRDFSELPIIRTSDFYGATSFLQTLNTNDLITKSSYEKITLSYWQQQVEQARALLNVVE